MGSPSETFPIPILDTLAPDGFVYGGHYVVEFDPDSLWYETSLSIVAAAVRSGIKTEYHVFQHFPEEPAAALTRLGVDVPQAESRGLLRFVDSYTQTIDYERARSRSGRSATPRPFFEGGPKKPLDTGRSSEAWARAARAGFPADEKRWLHLDDNTSIFLQYNSERDLLDAWRTALLPFAIRARETPHFLAFPTGIASEEFYRKFEALCDGIIDVKAEETGEQLRSYLRIRALRGRVFDSGWHALTLSTRGDVTLGTSAPGAEERILTTIMFTDLAGFTALAQRDERAALAALERHRELVRSVYPRFQGREIKTMGDGFLLEFPSALGASHCAVALQAAATEAAASSPPSAFLPMRIGIHLGDVVRRRGDLLGDSVNIASRIEALAEPGGVCVTGPVYDQIRNKLQGSFERLPSPRLKNVVDPIEVYKVRPPEVPSHPPSGEE